MSDISTWTLEDWSWWLSVKVIPAMQDISPAQQAAAVTVVETIATLTRDLAAAREELAAANATVEKLTNTLRIYADRNNWTNHDDWPTSDVGQVVFSRDATVRDMDTPGWSEAKAALTAAEAAREGKETT